MTSNTGPLNVVLVLPGVAPNPIGGYKVAFEYANSLSRSGHSVRIVQSWDFQGEQPYSAPLQRARRMRQLKAVLMNQRPNWFALDPDITVVNRFRARHTDAADADVVVATAARTAQFVMTACKAGGSAGIYFIQHFEDWDLPDERLRDTWKLPLHKIVIAPWLADIGETIGVDTTLIPNAIDPLEFPRGPDILERPLLVAAMLSPMPFKRADMVFEMFRDVLEAVPGASGVAFGVDPRPTALDTRVEYVQRPSRAHLRHIYQSARVYVCASDAEGWHLPPAEAMSSGAAIVSTEIGGVTAYASGSARFVPPGDSAALANAVVEVLSDQELNSRLANLGHAKIVRYSPAMAARSFEEEIRKLR